MGASKNLQAGLHTGLKVFGSTLLTFVIVHRTSAVMSEPFVTPNEASSEAAIAAIADELAVFDDWMDRYAYIIEMGRKLPLLPDTWMDDAHRVPGCQSKVWMEAAQRDGRLFFAGASDAAIVSGLVALLLRVYSGRSAQEILQTDPAFLQRLGLMEALSTNRGNGVAAMAHKLREFAQSRT